MAHVLNTFYCRGALGTRVNPHDIGWVWTGEFDLNTLRVDGDIFESGKEKLRIQKYSGTCGRGLENDSTSLSRSHKSWDPRGPMIWDKFSIFTTNCAILASYIHACVVVSRVDVVTLWIKYWELLDSLADFSQRWQGIRNQGSSMYYVLMLLVNERVSFQGRKFLDFALWMNNICSR